MLRVGILLGLRLQDLPAQARACGWDAENLLVDAARHAAVYRMEPSGRRPWGAVPRLAGHSSGMKAPPMTRGKATYSSVIGWSFACLRMSRSPVALGLTSKTSAVWTSMPGGNCEPRGVSLR